MNIKAIVLLYLQQIPNDLLTLPQFKTCLGIDTRIAQKLLETRQIEHFKVHNRIYIVKSTVINYLHGPDFMKDLQK